MIKASDINIALIFAAVATILGVIAYTLGILPSPIVHW